MGEEKRALFWSERLFGQLCTTALQEHVEVVKRLIRSDKEIPLLFHRQEKYK